MHSNAHCLPIHTHTHTHTYTHTHHISHIHKHTHTLAHIHIYIHTCCSHNLVICMDEEIRNGVLETVPLPYRKAYEEKVRHFLLYR